MLAMKRGPAQKLEAVTAARLRRNGFAAYLPANTALRAQRSHRKRYPAIFGRQPH